MVDVGCPEDGGPLVAEELVVELVAVLVEEVVDVDVVDEGGQLIAIGRGTFGTTGG